MARIPVYEQQQTLPGKSGAAPTQYVMDDAAQAWSDTGKRVYWLSSDMKKLAMEKKEDREAIQFARARANAKRSMAETFADFKNRTDYENFGEEWQERQAEIYESSLGFIQEKEAQEAFELWWSEAAPMAGIDVEEIIVAKDVDKQKADVLDTLSDYSKVGDFDNAEALLDAVGTRLWGAESAEKMKSSLLSGMAKDNMEMGISADPFNFDVEAQDYAKYLSESEVASYKEMQEDERERIVREREREIREAQTDNYNDLMWKMVSDQGTPSPQNVISMVRNGTLSKGQGATLIQMSRKVLDAQMERHPAGSGDLVRQLADSIDKNLSPDDPGYVSTDEVAKWIAEGKVHKDQIAPYKADLTNLQSVEGQVNRDRKSMGRTLVKNAIDEEGLDIKDEFAGEKLLADYNHKIASIEAYKGVLDENDGVLVATSLIKDYILDNDLKLNSWFFGANTSAGDVMEEVDRILAEIQKLGAADDLNVTPEPELSEESPSGQAVKPEPKESLDSIFGSAGE